MSKLALVDHEGRSLLDWKPTTPHIEVGIVELDEPLHMTAARAAAKQSTTTFKETK